MWTAVKTVGLLQTDPDLRSNYIPEGLLKSVLRKAQLSIHMVSVYFYIR
jgi:hypothetical protein